MIRATILADSIASGVRLTTFGLRFPRVILPQFLMHRVFARNAASNRARPTKGLIHEVLDDPYVPAEFLANRSGMVGGDPLDDEASEASRSDWLYARSVMMEVAERMARRGVHKQHANRLLETFQWVDVVVTATDYRGFYAQRIADDAQPEIRDLARAMKDAQDHATPVEVQRFANVIGGSWHLPLIRPDEDIPLDHVLAVAVGRCARVSYARHEEVRPWQRDAILGYSCARDGHWSPWEHVASPSPGIAPHQGPYDKPWVPLRHTYAPLASCMTPAAWDRLIQSLRDSIGPLATP